MAKKIEKTNSMQKQQQKRERKSKEKEAEKIDDTRWIWYNNPKIIITYNITIKRAERLDGERYE